ncbi:hypothetical protein Poli38472_002846 [Pythium oligandrum]|uniref:RRM domain-containing protein n=1 Tax=Pythium oligandrum TaxID=41045 RepID=A0A8K1C5Q2_PYTOL|nr:hypothetical protein Poli38472_002846 [Pythium oligandrum]|eukprot:TMW56921.1 hypothetical protein Poli38472_002846 [Pythium oligandrum]
MPPPGVDAVDVATDAAPGTTETPLMHALRVRNLPSVLSVDAVTSLLRHYGATRVRVLRRQHFETILGAKKPSQTAIAEFPSIERREEARRRLERFEVAGHKLVIEADDAETEATATTARAKIELLHTARSTTPPVIVAPPLPPPNPSNVGFAPAPLAPHLGLHYAPSPRLHYKYPKATVPIVRNIANALIALPRFYTQVLHLMNKMNLPPPFDVDAIPGVFSEARMAPVQTTPISKKRRLSSSNGRIAQNEEVEEDDESEDEKPTEGVLMKPAPPASNQTQMLVSHELKLTGKKRPLPSTTAVHGFELDRNPPRRRPGVISVAELDRQRLDPIETLQDPLFANYHRGEPSSTVCVRNLSTDVDENTLIYVFGHVLPSNYELSEMRVDLRQEEHIALLSFPSEAIANDAVDTLHCVVVSSKPMLVSFHQYPRTDYELSAQSLEATRATAKELEKEKAMKNYQRGSPSAALYIKNLAPKVDEAQIRAVCALFLPSGITCEELQIRYFAEGRMRHQAFVECPSVDVASTMVDKLHGIVIHEKPWVVCFRKTTSN